MPNKVLVQAVDGTPPQIRFRDSTDFSPTAANNLTIGTPTDVQMQWDGSITNATFRQSAKFDFGEHRAPGYACRAAIEFATAPTAGNVVNFFLAPSGSATAGTANAGGVSGADSAYTGYSSNAAASVLQLIYIGSFVCTTQATTTIQVAECGYVSPPERYGSLVIENASGVTIFTTDAAETHAVLDPVFDEIQ